MAEESETRPEKPVDAPDPKESPRRETGRRTAFMVVVGLAMLSAAIVALVGPFASAEDNATNWVWILPAAIAAMLVGALGWLVVYVAIPPEGRKRKG